MKYKQFLVAAGLLGILTTSAFFNEASAYAESASLDSKGSITFTGEYPKDIVDPEKPDEVVDPGESPKLDGNLRIDFVPKLNFYQNKISDKDEVYYANAQNFLSDTSARANFIQVTDVRSDGDGWTLQVRQDVQFNNQNTTNKEIHGAVMSFDQSWASSSTNISNTPQISKDTIRIENIGATYDLASAQVGQGKGTWSISFGSSGETQANTLEKRLDADGKEVLDSQFSNKTVYQNKAISLSIPGAAKVDPVQYKTMLTWILAELP